MITDSDFEQLKTLVLHGEYARAKQFYFKSVEHERERCLRIMNEEIEKPYQAGCSNRLEVRIDTRVRTDSSL